MTVSGIMQHVNQAISDIVNKTIIIHTLILLFYIMFEAESQNIRSVDRKVAKRANGQSNFPSNMNQPFPYEQQAYRKDDNIDNQIIVEKYRDLRRQQKDFLLKINLSTKLKRQIFGFTDTRDVKKPDQNQKLVTLIDPFKGRLIMKQRAWLQIEKEKENQRIKQQKQFYFAFQKQEQIKRNEKQQKQEKQRKAKQDWDKMEQQRIQNQNKTAKDKKINFADIFSFLPGLGKNKQNENKQTNKKVNQEIQQIVIQEKPQINKSRQKTITKSKLNILEQQKKQIDPKRYKINSNIEQRNLKINRNTNTVPYTPPKDATSLQYLKSNIYNKSNKEKINDNKLNNQILKSENRYKQTLNENEEIASQISEILKRQVSQQFSNPNFEVDQRLEDEGSEQILKQRQKRATKVGAQKKLRQ